jgi:hypothetical protein
LHPRARGLGNDGNPRRWIGCAYGVSDCARDCKETGWCPDAHRKSQGATRSMTSSRREADRP